MRLVVALGGNALLHRGEAPEADTQRRNVETAIANGIAPLARRHELVITHGNGPQIGLLALQAAAYPVVEGSKVVGIVSHFDFEGLELDRLDEETGLWERI